MTIFSDNTRLDVVRGLLNATGLRKNEFAGSRAPLPSDDETQGYEPGSRWMWQGQEWVATEVEAGAAVWSPLARSAFASREDAQAVRVPPPVTIINVAGLQYRRDSGGTALTTGDGATWSPQGDLYAEHFGADPTGTVDSTTSIQAALDYLQSIGGGVLYAPRSYLMSNSLQIHSNTHLDGCGTGVIRRDASSYTGTPYFARADSGAKNIGAKDITFDFGGDAPASGVLGFLLHGVKNVDFMRCTFKGTSSIPDGGSHSLDIGDANRIRVLNCRFLGHYDHNGVANDREYIQLDGRNLLTSAAGGCTDVIVRECYFGPDPDATGPNAAVLPVGVGNHFANASGQQNSNIRIEDCVFDNLPLHGIHCFAWDDVVVRANRFQECENGVFLSRGRDGYAKGCDAVIVSGNTFVDCQVALNARNNNYSEHNNGHTNIKFLGNTVQSIKSASRAALLYGVDSITISDNHMSVRGVAINIPSDRSNTIGVAVITANTCTSALVYNGAAGARFTVSDNTVVNTGTARAIHLTNAGFSVISGNNVIDCGGDAAIALFVGGKAIVSGNSIIIGPAGLQPSGGWVIRSSIDHVTITGNNIDPTILSVKIPALIATGTFEGACIGTPEGVIQAGRGSRVVRIDSTDADPVMYVKKSGSGVTGWIAV